MVKFGRKFFFDKVHTKKNHTLSIIITAVLVIAVVITFLVTRYFKEDKPEDKTPKVTFNKTLEIELYQELPNIKAYLKTIKNITENDFELVYPEELIISEDTSNCETPEDTNCIKQIANSIGEYKVNVKSEKIKEIGTVTLKVLDKTAPSLVLKEVKITEGETYKINDFIESCTDNSKTDCTFEYSSEDKNENDEIIDYSKYSAPGEYLIKIIAKDNSNNTTDKFETKLIINKKKETNKKPNNNNNNNNQTANENKCAYGDLSYSNSYVIATKINDSKCAISIEQANELSYKPGIEHNKKLIKEIQNAYLKNTIGNLNLEGEITYDITYGPVFNSSNKGVVGYYLLSEAKQTVNGKTTTLARYFIDENGNKVWKINTLNLK